MSVESAGVGEVSADPEAVSAILAKYDRIRTDAYRPADSLRLIKEALDEWTSMS
ncbi:hypothetical protein [Spongiactinospora rosea]|uniref:hypothetical protein n=1 Tax=Spongiactinospora rosea TaxID=2248750 RepID=UPI00384ADD86